MMSENLAAICAVCKTPAVQLCAGCKSVYYCNREHQKKHWKEGHKNNCAIYKIASVPGVGQYLIAARDIKQNEVILKETPIIIAPHTQSFVTCLGCNKRVRESNGKNVYRCSSCNWPLCSQKCQEANAHKNECKIMTEKNYKAEFIYSEKEKFDVYNVIAPLRTLMLKTKDKSKFESMINLLNQPAQSTMYKEQKLDNIKLNIVPFINDVLQLNFSEDEIINSCCLFDVNSLDIVKDDGEINVRGLYLTTSLLKHNCISNTKQIFSGNNHQLILIATVPIQKGEMITTCHSEVLWGTLSRLANLKEKKYLECKCKRCSDATEVGTNMGGIFCIRCKKTNEEVCPKILSTEPLNSAAIWKCEKCDHIIKGRQMIWGNDAIKSEMNRVGKNPLSLEQFLVKYKEVFHAKNYHALVAKYALCQIYGNVKGYQLSDLTDTILERKIDICHELLEIIDVLAPGFSTIRGSLLYELQSAMVVQTKREFNSGKITKAAAQDTLTECMIILKEATDILSADPEMKEFLQDSLQQLANELDIE